MPFLFSWKNVYLFTLHEPITYSHNKITMSSTNGRIFWTKPPTQEESTTKGHTPQKTKFSTLLNPAKHAWRLWITNHNIKQSHFPHPSAHPSSHITSRQRQTNNNNRRSLACLNYKSSYQKTRLSVSRPQKNLKMRNTTKHQIFHIFMPLKKTTFHASQRLKHNWQQRGWQTS